MTWRTVAEAEAESTLSRATIFRRVKAGTIPSYTDAEGSRWIWCSPAEPWEAVLTELVELRQEVAKLRSEGQSQRESHRATGQVLRVVSTPPRPARALPRPRPKKPAAVKAEGSHQTLVERLVALAGGVKDAAALLGMTRASGRVTVSRWRSGKRNPGSKSLEQIMNVIAQLEQQRSAA